MKDSKEDFLVEGFRYTGKWWLPDNPAIQIPGTLRFGQVDGAILDLQGDLAGDTAMYRFNPAIINGISSDGKDFTLYRCLGRGKTIHHGEDFKRFETSTLFAHTVFVGVAFKSEKDITFNQLWVRYSHFDVWVGISGFTFEDNRVERVLRYKPPNTIGILIDDELTLYITFIGSWAPYSVTEPQMTQETWLVIVPSKPTHLEKYLQVMRRLEIFLSFAMCESIHPLGIRGKTEFAKWTKGDFSFYEDVGVFYQLASTPKQKTTASFEPMFRYETVANRFEDILRNWFKKAERLEPIYELYFVSVYGRQMYQEQKFLCLIQALESYHRRMVNNRELSEKDHKKRIEEIMRDVPSEYQKWLRRKLDYSNEPTLRRRLKELLNRFATPASSLIEDRRAFVSEVCNTRNYLTHYDPKLKNAVAKGNALDRITWQLTALVEMCLLEELGFTLDEVHNCVSTKYSGQKSFIAPDS